MIAFENHPTKTVTAKNMFWSLIVTQYNLNFNPINYLKVNYSRKYPSTKSNYFLY